MINAMPKAIEHSSICWEEQTVIPMDNFGCFLVHGKNIQRGKKVRFCLKGRYFFSFCYVKNNNSHLIQWAMCVYLLRFFIIISWVFPQFSKRPNLWKHRYCLYIRMNHNNMPNHIMQNTQLKTAAKIWDNLEKPNIKPNVKTCFCSVILSWCEKAVDLISYCIY